MCLVEALLCTDTCGAAFQIVGILATVITTSTLNNNTFISFIRKFYLVLAQLDVSGSQEHYKLMLRVIFLQQSCFALPNNTFHLWPRETGYKTNQYTSLTELDYLARK